MQYIVGKASSISGMTGKINTSSSMSGQITQENQRATGIINIPTGSIEKYDEIISDTTANWNDQKTLISKKNIVYVYTDHESTTVDGETVYIPGIKIGDGKAYLIDLPFTDAIMMEHINNHVIHVTQDDKDFWNNKVRCYIDNTNDNRLVFTTE